MQNSCKSYEDGFCNNLLHFLLLIFSKFMLHKFTNSSNHKPTSGSHQLSYTQGKIFMHANQSSRQELKLVFLLFLLRPILLQLSLLLIAAYRINILKHKTAISIKLNWDTRTWGKVQTPENCSCMQMKISSKLTPSLLIFCCDFAACE